MKKLILFLLFAATTCIAQTNTPTIIHTFRSSFITTNCIPFQTNIIAAITNQFTSIYTNKEVILWNSNGAAIYVSSTNGTKLITTIP